MTDYTELVKALRYHVNADEGWSYRPIQSLSWDCIDRIMTDAADAIEALIADVEKKESRITGLGNRIFALEQQLPKRGEWVEENRRPRSSQFVCSECHRTAYDPQPTRDKAWRKRCRYAYCPNCGAKMTEVQDGNK